MRGSKIMNIEIATLMIQDENFIGAICFIAFLAGQIPGVIRLMRDTNNGCIVLDLSKKRN